MTETQIPPDMNFTLGCLYALAPFHLVRGFVTRARSFGTKGKEPRDESCVLPEQILCNMSLFLRNCAKEKEKKKIQPCGQSCKWKDWLLHWRSLKSSRQKKLRWTYPVSVWGNLWGLKLSTAAVVSSVTSRQPESVESGKATQKKDPKHMQTGGQKSFTSS